MTSGWSWKLPGPLNRTTITADWITGTYLKESDKEQGHQKAITSLPKSVEWSHFLKGSFDKSAKLWDTRTLTLIKTYVTEQPVNSVDISPLLDHVVIGGGQDAMNVTMTDHCAGKFEAKLFQDFARGNFWC
uniref:Serine-threonine kinase receptor-associated protein n=1 Tax=Oryza punctata TaxID=4537 RepID=A0A0E0MH19_ORYPU